MKDLYNNIAVSMDFEAQTISATQTAVEIDLAGCNSAVFAIAFGEEGGTLSGSLGWTVTMTHADDDGTGSAGDYANVEAKDVQGVTPSSGIIITLDAAAEDSTVYKVGYIGDKRFVKLLLSEVGTTAGIPVTILTIKSHLQDVPVVA